jgi:hypothetical protein
MISIAQAGSMPVSFQSDNQTMSAIGGSVWSTERRNSSRFRELQGLSDLRLFEMDWRDRRLLGKQLRRLAPSPRSNGTLMLAIVAVFLTGIAVGGLMFAYKTEPPVQTASDDGTAALSFFLNGTPVTRHN